MRDIQIGGQRISHDAPCFIIGEAGVNHNGDLEMALKLVDAARDAGADAVKFQTFQTDALVLPGVPQAKYQSENGAPGKTQHSMLKKLELSKEMHRQISAHCARRGIVFLSSAFDESSADFLQTLDMEAFKIGSGEITNIPLLTHIARYGRPMFLSTGMCCLAEVEAAIMAIEGAGNPYIVLLHCVSAYPTPPSDVNLRAMQTLRAAFHLPVGYSDHSLGMEVPLAAVAMGACVIEKHLTLDRTLPGPDHRASSEPEELKAFVAAVRKVEAALGDGRKRCAQSEIDTAAAARKSLVASVQIPAGAVIATHMLGAKRPGTGLPPTLQPYIVGRVARRTINPDELIALNMLD